MTGTSLLPLSTLAGTIKAHIAAGDKAVGKADEHYTAAGIHLLEAKERVKRTANLTWPAFLVSQCSIQRSRADELIAIAEGRTSLVELRAAKNESSKAAHARTREAARQSPLNSGKSEEFPQSFQTESVSAPSLSAEPHRHTQVELPKRMKVFDRIIEQLKKLDAEALSELETHITENYDV